ncbi:MAG: bifunctional hydroxymethylpyrimidine kinase/phosphomethylpyrimidine kinase [Deltaproteobacteria bacterium]|nr:bifunctional hydroxymethylpyrimidine kinase/phosphomethylpyrimidine kinase [Deltaproteobacteria bacterium]
MVHPSPRLVLTIAGSDPSGGAGVQADLRVFANHGLYGMAVITGLTVQGGRGVRAARPVAPKMVREQLDELLADYPIAAIKTGMLATAATVCAVADALEPYGGSIPLVVDPVIRSSSGHALLAEDALPALVDRLLPLATVVTPNFAEAAALLGWERVGPRRAAEASQALGAMGSSAVVVTGGHGRPGDPAVDHVFALDGFEGGSGAESYQLISPWVDTANNHGTGCLFSAGICCALAEGSGLKQALQHGKDCVTEGLRSSVGLGAGRGVVWLEKAPSR